VSLFREHNLLRGVLSREQHLSLAGSREFILSHSYISRFRRERNANDAPRLWAIVMEAVLLGMTVRKLWNSARHVWTSTTATKPIVRLLILDGTWAFFVVFGKCLHFDSWMFVVNLRSADVSSHSHLPRKRYLVHKCSRSACIWRTHVRRILLVMIRCVISDRLICPQLALFNLLRYRLPSRHAHAHHTPGRHIYAAMGIRDNMG
jgi:hypothetical protein